jgi:sarcosine oxidase gamma subunit
MTSKKPEASLREKIADREMARRAGNGERFRARKLGPDQWEVLGPTARP